MQGYISEEIKINNETHEIYLYGNNLNCIYCSKTYRDFKTDNLIDIKILQEKIKEFNPIRVILKGGEPLLQKQAIITILKFCKKNKIKTIVETNLTKPKILNTLLKTGLIDKIIAIIRTNKKDFRKINRAGTFFESSDELFSKVKESLKILKKYEQEIEIKIKTTIVPGYVYRKETLIDIGNLIKEINTEWQLEKFQNKDTLEMFKNIEPPTDLFMKNLKFNIEKQIKNINISIN